MVAILLTTITTVTLLLVSTARLLAAATHLVSAIRSLRANLHTGKRNTKGPGAACKKVNYRTQESTRPSRRGRESYSCQLASQATALDDHEIPRRRPGDRSGFLGRR